MSTPQTDRPRFHESYGIWAADEGAGLLAWEWATERLERAHNYWVATASEAGRPHAAPVWGLWQDGVFFFSTARGSRKGQNLAVNPFAVVHLESGDEVVIVEGPVEEVTDRIIGEAIHADASDAGRALVPHPLSVRLAQRRPAGSHPRDRDRAGRRFARGGGG